MTTTANQYTRKVQPVFRVRATCHECKDTRWFYEFWYRVRGWMDAHRRRNYDEQRAKHKWKAIPPVNRGIGHLVCSECHWEHFDWHMELHTEPGHFYYVPDWPLYLKWEDLEW